YRQKLTVGSWEVMTVIYYVAMISHQGLIRIFPKECVALWDSFTKELKARNKSSKKDAQKARAYS
uniref:hypothetical protein n=1 Tax=Shewanella indica TaxID=768528 RepID=UPI0030072B74